MEIQQSLLAPALRMFGNIADRWGLTDLERQRILGSPDESIERISYVLGIYKGINTLLQVPERADGWIRAANTATPFNGRSPIELIARGNIKDLKAVRRYLEAEVEAPFA